MHERRNPIRFVGTSYHRLPLDELLAAMRNQSLANYVEGTLNIAPQLERKLTHKYGHASQL
jgi:hypothetical protein